MPGIPARIALISMHTSPAARPGSGDAGGMNVVVRSLATELAHHNVEVEILTRAMGRPSEFELEPGVVVRELSAGPPGPMAKDDLAHVTDEFGQAVAALTGREAGEYYDLIHAHYWLSGIAALPAALEHGLPFVQSFHTLAAMKNREAPSSSDREAERRIGSEAFLANQATALIAGSAAEATCLIETVRAPANRVWVIPPGVDVDVFRPNRTDAHDRVRAKYSIAQGRPILVVAGRVQPLKDQELAIRSLALLREAGERRPVLVVAGAATPGDEGYARGLRELAAELGVADSVRFPGTVDREELAQLFAAATLTIVSSKSETFGLVALESAASGTPVLGFRGSGMLESIAEGTSGVLVDSREPRAWAEAIDGLLTEPERLAALSATARDHALGYTWAASATALLGVYGSLQPR